MTIKWSGGKGNWSRDQDLQKLVSNALEARNLGLEIKETAYRDDTRQAEFSEVDRRDNQS